MAKFFIDRPIFAWVVAIFIIIAGLLGINSLPVSQYPSVAAPTITMTADDGHMSSKGEQVDLTGNVRIHRAATGKDAEMVVTAPQLSILPDEEKAYTRHPVLMTQGNSWIKGVGFRMDNRARTYLLEAQARASLESKQQARKKKP